MQKRSTRDKTMGMVSLKKFGNSGTALLTVTALLSIAAAPVFTNVAAAEEGAGNSAKSDVGRFEEIVVTARKVAENIQDVPISMTAFSGKDLEVRGVSDLGDIGQYIPNVSIGERGDTTNINIRGVNNYDPVVTADPAVGLYIDGVYLARTQGALLDMIDIERVEVLKGPQGTLFGKNTIGGAVNIVSKPPSGDGSGRVSVTAGTRGRIDASFSVDLGLADTLALKISGVSKNRGCLIRRWNDDACLGDEDTRAGRLYARFTPTETFKADLIFDYTDRDSHAPRSGIENLDTSGLFPFVHNGAVDGGLIDDQRFDETTVIGVDDPWVTGGGASTINHLTQWGVSLNMSWEVSDNATLVSISSYRDTDHLFSWDYDSSPIELFAISPQITTADQFSQELRVDGTSLNGALNWTVGGYYMDENALQDFSILRTAAIAPFDDFQGFIEGKVESIAGFMHFSYEVLDDLRVSGGVRYTSEKRGNESMFRFFTDPPGVFSFINAPYISDRWDAFSPKISVDYKLNDDAMVYGSVSRGFRSGGFFGNSSSSDIQNKRYDPEYLTSYELGWKSDWLDGRLRVNGALFYSDYTNRQLTVIVQDPSAPPGTLVSKTDNAGKSRTKGFELDVQALVASGLTIEGSVGYVDFDYTELDPAVTSTCLECPFPYTSKFNATAAIDYVTPKLIEGGQTRFRIDYSYQSRYYFLTYPPELGSVWEQYNSQKPYSLVNGNISFTPDDDSWSISLYGKNIFNQHYRTSSFGLSDIGFAFMLYGEPSEYGANLTVNF